MKIKEVEDLVQMSSQTIRYYDKLGFLHPSRDDNGYRNYTMDDVMILKRIRFLRELDISLDHIKIILNNPNEFQNVLSEHIELLKSQISNLEEIEKKCIEINKLNLPFLDTMVKGEFKTYFTEKDSIIKEVLSKTKDFVQPFTGITLGHKTTSFEMIKKLSIICLLCLFISFLTIPYLYLFIYAMFESAVSTYTSIIIIFILFFLAGMGMIKEKYFEFRDNDFYFYNSYQQNKFKVIQSILKNKTREYAYHYYYTDINKVEIQVVKKYSAFMGYGAEKTFQIVFRFDMNDGKTFAINSSFFKDNQHRKTILDILEYHDVLIEDKYNFRNGLELEHESLYDYLDRNI